MVFQTQFLRPFYRGNDGHHSAPGWVPRNLIIMTLFYYPLLSGSSRSRARFIAVGKCNAHSVVRLQHSHVEALMAPRDVTQRCTVTRRCTGNVHRNMDSQRKMTLQRWINIFVVIQIVRFICIDSNTPRKIIYLTCRLAEENYRLLVIIDFTCINIPLNLINIYELNTQ